MRTLATDESVEDSVLRRHDAYYMDVARAVRGDKDDNTPSRDGANCRGSKVGAVLVLGEGQLGERIVSTGYNGTPAGFLNCLEGGCVRCANRNGQSAGSGLDRCVCVHAEQNALLTAARFGISVEGATVYTTLSPCFGCPKESMQAGVKRIVYEVKYEAKYDAETQDQYDRLVDHLRYGDVRNFEPLGGQAAAVDDVGQFPES